MRFNDRSKLEHTYQKEMLKNFIFSTWRNFKAHPGITSLNVFGLSLAIAVFLFIFFYAQREWSYDQFHEDVELTYRIEHIRKRPGQEPYRTAGTFPGLAPVLTEELDEVIATCRVVPVWGNKGLLIHKENVLESDYINYVDDNFFGFFSFPLLEGNPTTVLKDAQTAVISESVKNRLFGQNMAIGENIELKTRDGVFNYEIRGIYDDTKASHIKGDILLSYRSLFNIVPEIENNFTWYGYPTYLKVAPNVNLVELDKKFIPILDKYGGERRGSKVNDFDLQALADIHLTSHLHSEIAPNGDGKVVRFLMIIGVFVLIIAWVNFINLYTAKTTDRAKEVGIRKTLGASKGSVMLQFLFEAAIINLLAITFGIIILWTIVPYVASIANVNMLRTDFINREVLPLLGIFWILSTTLSGLYPSLFVSNFSPLKALSQKGGRSASGIFRKVLVVTQFMAATALIGGTLVTYEQLSFMNATDIGIDTDNVVVIDAYNFERDEPGHLRKVEAFKNAIVNRGGVNGVAFSSEVIGQPIGWRGGAFKISEADTWENRKILYKLTVDRDYLDLYGVELLAGRGFLRKSDSANIVINRSAMELFGFNNPEDALNQRIVFTGRPDTTRIIGIVENYYHESLREGFKPTAYIQLAPEISKVSVKIDTRKLAGFLTFAQQEFEGIFPKSPFKYIISDELIAKRHETENSFLKCSSSLRLWQS